MPEEPKWVRLDQIKAAVGGMEIVVETPKQGYVVTCEIPKCFPKGSLSEGFRVGVSFVVRIEGSEFSDSVHLEVSNKDAKTLYPTLEAFRAEKHNPSVCIGKDLLREQALKIVISREKTEEKADELRRFGDH